MPNSFPLVYETGNKLVLRAAGNGGNTVVTVEHELTAAQIAAGELEVIWTFDVDNGDPATGQTIALYIDGAVVGEESGDMDPDWTGANGASFGIATGSFAAGGGNTALNDDVDFASGSINLEKGLQMFADTLFEPDGPVDPEPTGDFRIIAITRTDSGVELNWASENGTSYNVDYSEDLGSWTTITNTAVTAVGEVTGFEDTDITRTGEETGYYRVTRE